MSKLRILFATAINDLKTTAPDYPVGLFYILANVRKCLGDTVDCRFVQKDYYAELQAYDPDLVMISSPSCGYRTAIEYGRKAKELGKKVVLGGCHIRTLAPSMSRAFDVGVTGEGEYVTVDLIRHYLENNRSFDLDKLESTTGLVFWNGARLVNTGPAPEIADLDSLPLPDRSPLRGISSDLRLFFTRGCPYRCSYCAATVMSKRVRKHSAEYMIEDLKQVLALNPSRHVLIYDDLFAVDKARIESFVRLLEKEKLLGKLTFFVQNRANLVDEELVQLLVRMGMTFSSMGLDSGNDEVLNYLKGNSVSVADNYRAVSLFQKHRVFTYSSFIIGSPKETSAQVQDTYDLIIKSGLTSADALILVPLPGTQVWKEALDRGLVSENEDFDWESINYQRPHSVKRPIIMSEVLTARELSDWLLKFQRLKGRMALRFLPTRYRWQYLKDKNVVTVASQLSQAWLRNRTSAGQEDTQA